MFRFLQPEHEPIVNDSTFVVIDSKNINERNLKLSKQLGAELLVMRAIMRALPKTGHKNSSNHPLKSIISTNFTSNGQGVYTFTLNVQGAVKQSTAGNVAYAAVAINPSGATNWSALSALFDQYRTKTVSFSMIPLPTNLGAVAPAGGITAICVDTDSVTAPTSLDQLLQYDDVWVGSLQNPPGRAGLGYPVDPYKFVCAKASVEGAIGATHLGQWIDIASVAGTGSVQIAVEDTAGTANLYTYVLSMQTQFKFVR